MRIKAQSPIRKLSRESPSLAKEIPSIIVCCDCLKQDHRVVWLEVASSKGNCPS